MSLTTEAPNDSRVNRAAALAASRREVDVTPVPARVAVGRYTGIARSRPAPRTPLWRSAGIAGLIALVAAAATPVIAEMVPFTG